MRPVTAEQVVNASYSALSRCAYRAAYARITTPAVQYLHLNTGCNEQEAQGILFVPSIHPTFKTYTIFI
jgi:hypothetical protein